MHSYRWVHMLLTETKQTVATTGAADHVDGPQISPLANVSLSHLQSISPCVDASGTRSGHTTCAHHQIRASPEPTNQQQRI